MVEFMDWKMEPDPIECCIPFFPDNINGFDHRYGRTVIAINDPYLVCLQEVHSDSRMPEGFHGRQIGVFPLLCHPHTHPSWEQSLQVRPVDNSRQPGSVAQFFPTRINPDTRPALIQGLLHLFHILTNGGIDP